MKLQEAKNKIEKLKKGQKHCNQCGEIYLIEKWPDSGFCQSCENDLRQFLQVDDVTNYVQVTREMAIDAGDRDLEGQWIKWW